MYQYRRRLSSPVSLPLSQYTGGIGNQTARALGNIKAIMLAGGAKMADIVEGTVLMTDLADYAALNVVYATFFDADNAPARAAFQVVT